MDFWSSFDSTLALYTVKITEESTVSNGSAGGVAETGVEGLGAGEDVPDAKDEKIEAKKPPVAAGFETTVATFAAAFSLPVL